MEPLRHYLFSVSQPSNRRAKEFSVKLKKVITGLGTAIAAFGLVLGSAPSSLGAIVPDYKAKAGDE